jgi:hypothetical protein
MTAIFIGACRIFDLETFKIGAGELGLFRMNEVNRNGGFFRCPNWSVPR